MTEPWDNQMLTRRAFVAGALALGSCALPLAACGRSGDSGEVQPLDVPSGSVVSLDAFRNLKFPERYYRTSEVATLDAGTQLFGTGGKVAAALCTGASARPLMTLGLLDLQSGSFVKALDKAQEDGDGYTIAAVRASDELAVWVESNFLTGEWSVYAAPLDVGKLSLGTASRLDHGDAGYDTPEIACLGSNAYWIVQPDGNGDRRTEDSQLKVWAGGSSSVICTSRGRFNGGLAVSGQTVTAMPRADTSSGIYYQLTAFRSGSGTAVASQVMPRSFRPACAIYLDNAFSFSIGASYDYGGGIAGVGTYYPLSDGEWLRLAKTPVTPAGMCDGLLFCKSGSRTVFIDLEERTYFTVDAPDGATSYGDYSVATGEVPAVYNYATISKVRGSRQEKSVVVRRISPR